MFFMTYKVCKKHPYNAVQVPKYTHLCMCRIIGGISDRRKFTSVVALYCTAHFFNRFFSVFCLFCLPKILMYSALFEEGGGGRKPETGRGREELSSYIFGHCKSSPCSGGSLGFSLWGGSSEELVSPNWPVLLPAQEAKQTAKRDPPMEITLEGVSPIGITPGSLDYSCQPVRRLAQARDKGEGCVLPNPSTHEWPLRRGRGNGGGGPARGWGSVEGHLERTWRRRGQFYRSHHRGQRGIPAKSP